jgi:hypothetical protein
MKLHRSIMIADFSVKKYANLYFMTQILKKFYSVIIYLDAICKREIIYIL